MLCAGNKEMLQLLISKGAEIDINSESGTPLQCAAHSGKREAVKILLDNKANVRQIPQVSAAYFSCYYVESTLSDLIFLAEMFLDFCSTVCFQCITVYSTSPLILSFRLIFEC